MKLPLIRHPQNPIIKPQDLPFRAYTVMNTGATIFEGKVLLLLRIEYCDRTTHFHVAKSEDGVNFTVNPEEIKYPLSYAEKQVMPAHRFDMRITPIEGRFLITHAAWMAGWGCSIGMAETKDFVNFEPFDYLSVPSNRNGTIFPEKINGLYARLERPQDVDGKGKTWISYSPDLEFWGKSMPVVLPENNSWNGYKSGPGPIPIKTDRGWLVIYHATTMTASTENYHLGAMMLDLKDPSKVIACPAEFILAPETMYEYNGQTPNVVFSNGAVVMPDGTLNVYYGAADTVTCLAQTTVEDLVDYCFEVKPNSYVKMALL